MEKVPFDPGIGKFVSCFSQDMEYAMGQVLATKSPNQRKFKFQILYPKMLSFFENVTGFYAGCLLWAYYIKNAQNGAEKEITGNNFLGQDFENNDKFDFLYEINYLIEYFDKFQKDVNFFLNKPIKLDKHWLFISTTYKKFLELNNNFVKVKTTADLKIPEEFTPKASVDEIKHVFDKVLANGQLSEFISSSVN